MSLPELSVRRPVAVSMAVLAVVVFGLLTAGRLPVELLPNLSYPSLTIQTVYPDAAPASVEQFVTRPIEEAVGVIHGVRSMRSVSRAGLSEVVLEFDWDERMEFVALDVREKLGLVALPREAETPRVLRYDPSLDPIMRLALTGDRPLDELRRVAERWLAPRLEAIAGVAAAKVHGGLEPEVVVEADEDRLAALGLTLGDLATALRAENVNRPGGTVKDWGAVYLVRTLNEFENLDAIRRTIVRELPAGRVRVEDVAKVRRGHRDRTEITRSGGSESVEIAIHREGSANTVAAASAVRRELDRIRSELGKDFRLEVLSDQSRFIERAISEVRSGALVGGLLAIFVLFFFLRDLRATAVIALTIPISVITTFLAMGRAGVSLNVMSLGGLALGVGMLVDNSIVVLEAIDRHLRSGRDRASAAIAGAREVAGAVTAATLTTVCVFLPIVFVVGVAGQLFRDLAVTVCLSLLASLAVSLTLIPSLAGLGTPSRTGDDAGPGLRLGRFELAPLARGGTRAGRLAASLVFPLRVLLLVAAAALGLAWDLFVRLFALVTWPLARAFEVIGAGYPAILSSALRRRWPVLLGALALFAGALAWLPRLGTNLLPDLAQGEFAFRIELPEGTPLETTASVVERIEAPLLEDPRFARVFSVIGSLPSNASGRRTLGENLAQIDFALTSGVPEEEAVARVRQLLRAFPTVEAELVRPSVLTLRPPIAVNIFSDELDVLSRVTQRAARAIAAVPGVSDVITTAEPGSPEIRIALDRDRAAALGVTAEEVGETLRRQLRGEVVGKFREREERIDLRVRASENWRDRASEVGKLRLRLPGGQVVEVGAVADVRLERGPAAIHRWGGARVAQVIGTASAADLGRTLDAVRESVARLAEQIAAENPGTVIEMAGQDEELATSFRSLRLALALAVFLVYVVMAMQFESLRHPFVILLSVPLGLIGVVAALAVTGTGISILALIGVVMLAGIVVNNAIVLVDAVNRRRREGEPLDQAIGGGGRERLRPILMTTMTTVLALLPMALGLGAGGELRAPLAITVIGGLTGATVLTLIVIPCVYRVLAGSVRRSDAAASSGPARDGVRA